MGWALCVHEYYFKVYWSENLIFKWAPDRASVEPACACRTIESFKCANWSYPLRTISWIHCFKSIIIISSSVKIWIFDAIAKLVRSSFSTWWSKYKVLYKVCEVVVRSRSALHTFKLSNFPSYLAQKTKSIVRCKLYVDREHHLNLL